MQTFYSILGVTPDSETEVIDAAYRALMKKHHPDRSGQPDDERSRAINEAYAVLKDERKRRAYDSQLRKARDDNGRAVTLTTGTHWQFAGTGDHTASTKRCPDCAELIQAQARVCRYCGANFDKSTPTETPTAAPTPKRFRWWHWALLAFLGLIVFLYRPGGPVDDTDSENLSAAEGTADVATAPDAVASNVSESAGISNSQPGSSRPAELLRGTCKDDSEIAEGPIDEDISSDATPFACDTMAGSFDLSNGDVSFTFASHRGGTAPSITFAGGLDEKNMLTVERVIISGSEPMDVDGGVCRLFFPDGAKEGIFADVTDVVCGARITNDGRAIVTKVVFSAAR
jgi:hypothetical protein